MHIANSRNISNAPRTGNQSLAMRLAGKEKAMPSKRHNTQAGEEQRGSSGDNIRQ